MFLTRLGFGSKAVVTGDVTQIDLPVHSKSGLLHARHILDGVKGVKFITFDEKGRHPPSVGGAHRPGLRRPRGRREMSVSGPVEIIRETRLDPRFPLSRPELGALAETLLDALGLTGRTFELKLVDDREIARLNSEFLGCTGPTNILSFPAHDAEEGEETGGEIGDPGEQTFLGELALSVDAPGTGDRPVRPGPPGASGPAPGSRAVAPGRVRPR